MSNRHVRYPTPTIEQEKWMIIIIPLEEDIDFVFSFAKNELLMSRIED